MIDTKMLLAIGLAAVLGMAGVKAHKTLSDKAVAQANVTDGVLRYQSSYQALQESTKRWDESYQSVGRVTDLVSLTKILQLEKYGLNADADKIQLAKVDPVSQNGSPLGMTKICLTNRGNADFVVTAADFNALFNGIRQLASRLDVHMEMFSFSGEKEAAARITDFCILVRN